MGNEKYWDDIAHQYHDNILGPHSPSMVAFDDKGRCRNLLVNRFLGSAFGFQGKSIADFGCGPGNMIEHIAPKVDALTGVDVSGVALAIAENRARACNVSFSPIKADIRTFFPSAPYDLIVSVNSILPETRADVLAMLQAVRRSLSKSGEFWAIMPSFDTIDHLLNCMEGDISAQYGQAVALAEIESFKAKHKYNAERLSYADDGNVEQCYHTPESLVQEFAAAGLEITESLQKVYYPWEYAREYDYGYYPGEEEIWDWFVVAKPL